MTFRECWHPWWNPGAQQKRRRNSRHGWRGEAFAVFAGQDFLVRLVMVVEPVFRGIPAQFLARITCRLHRQQRRFRDARADVEGRPERFLVAETVVGPVLPMVARRHFWQRLILHRFALAENRDRTVG